MFIGCASAMMGIGGGLFIGHDAFAFGVRDPPCGRHRGAVRAVRRIAGHARFRGGRLGRRRIPSGAWATTSLDDFACIAPVTVLTAPLGARIAHALPAMRLTMLFGGFLIIARYDFLQGLLREQNRRLHQALTLVAAFQSAQLEPDAAIDCERCADKKAQTRSVFTATPGTSARTACPRSWSRRATGWC